MREIAWKFFGRVGKVNHYFSLCCYQWFCNINMFVYTTIVDVMNNDREVVKTIVCWRWRDFFNVSVHVRNCSFELFLLVQLIHVA